MCMRPQRCRITVPDGRKHLRRHALLEWVRRVPNTSWIAPPLDQALERYGRLLLHGPRCRCHGHEWRVYDMQEHMQAVQYLGRDRMQGIVCLLYTSDPADE